MISDEVKHVLIEKALLAREKSYSPYSNFSVGAALLDCDGNIYTGCNIENAAFGPSNCAERTAFFKAVSDGVKDFSAIAIVGGLHNASSLEYCTPCGVCRQVMREFCDDSFKIIIAKDKDNFKTFTLSELIPESFGPNNLK